MQLIQLNNLESLLVDVKRTITIKKKHKYKIKMLGASQTFKTLNVESPLIPISQWYTFVVVGSESKFCRHQ